jgi:hypothetical protein
MKYLMSFIEDLGGIWIFFFKIMRTAFTTSGNFRPILGQISYVS